MALIDRHQAAIDDPVNAEQAVELRCAITALAAGLTRTPRPEIARMMGRLANIYRAEKLTRAEAEGRVQSYQDLLDDIPPDLLALAFKRAAQRCRFFPTVAEIREQVAADLAVRRFRLGKAEWMVADHERRWKPPGPPITADQAEAVAAGLNRLASLMSAGPALTPEAIEARETQRDELLARFDAEAACGYVNNKGEK